MRSVRITAKWAARVFGNGPAAGALLFAALFVLELFAINLEFMGFSDDKATDVIVARYGRKIVLDQLLVLGVQLGVGALLGGFGAFVGRQFDRARLRTPSRARAFGRGFLAALLGHAAFFIHHLVTYPQLYGEWLYDRGGWRRGTMRFLTDHVRPALGPALVGAALLGLSLAWLATPYGWRRALASVEWLVLRRRRAAVAGGVVLAVLLGGWVWSRPRTVKAHSKPNVLVLAVDSLRADRVFGEGAKRFPTLSKLAAEGVRFREAHVTVPRTFPSFVTLLTGRFPHHHGIRHMFPPAETRQSIGPTLPSVLRANGYRTLAISDYAGEIFTRTPLGFSDIDAPYFDMKTILEQRGLAIHPSALPYATSWLLHELFPSVDAMPERSDPALLARRAERRLDELGDTPFMMVVFFSAAHFPYASPAPFYDRFRVQGYDGPFRYQKPPLVPVSDGDIPQIRSLYDGAIAATDDAIGELLGHLRKRGLDRDTIVILLADHGENLYEAADRGMGHGDHLRGDSTDHVPLVIVDPRHRFAPHDVPGIVRDVDVAPTLAALADAGSLASDGVDLAPLLKGGVGTLELDAFGETEYWLTPSGPGFGPEDRIPYPGVTGATEIAADDDVVLRPEWEDTVVVGKHRSLRTLEWKLIYEPTRAGVRWRLERAGAVGESPDVSAEHPDVVAALRPRLERWISADPRMIFRGGFAVPK